ncbi:tetratricopeptide repeat protein [Thalassotalea litorea]|uniref:tetratricopeptide repeat protein n=1 Tax=Thalassotalea litorea TaxID=2020715 RepID=UPI003736DB05
MKFSKSVLFALGTGLMFSASDFSLFSIESSNGSSAISIFSQVQAAEDNTRKTKRVPAMRERVYSQLARAQKIADGGDTQAGIEVLDAVKDRLSSLNSYEKAMLFNFYGFLYYGIEDVDNAITSFEKVVADKEGVTDALYMSTLYSLAQLHMQKQDYIRAEQALKNWQTEKNGELNASEHVLFAQVFYQQKNYQKALNSIDNAIAISEQSGEALRENWLILKRAAHYELKQPQQVTRVMEQMVRLYNKPQYWLQLSGMYGEIGEEDKQLAVMEAAWQAGYISKEEDIMTLAQLYVYHQLPYKAALLMQSAMDDGRLAVDLKRLQLLSQSYMLAKEDDKAIPVLVQASEISETGEFDAQLAQAYLNLEQWQKAIESAEQALNRGGVENIGDMHLAMGMGHFNLKRFEQSLLAFAQAEDVPEVRNTAQQWSKYVEKEKGYYVQLAQVQN